MCEGDGEVGKDGFVGNAAIMLHSIIKLVHFLPLEYGVDLPSSTLMKGLERAPHTSRVATSCFPYTVMFVSKKSISMHASLSEPACATETTSWRWAART